MMPGNNVNKTAAWVLAVILGMAWTAVSAVPSWADSSGGGRSKHPDPARFVWHLLKAKDSLGLTDEQEARLKTIAVASKKDTVKKTAEIDLVEIDMHQVLHGRDTQASGDEIDGTVRKLYALKAERRIASIKAFRDARAVLTPEQQKKMRELHSTRRACTDGRGSEQSGSGDRRAEADSPAETHSPTESPSVGQPDAEARMNDAGR
jgi:Spy/CpxP family protein refolding chaperone